MALIPLYAGTGFRGQFSRGPLPQVNDMIHTDVMYITATQV